MVLFYAVFRVIRNHAYAGTLGERLGFLPPGFQQSSGGAIWVHAVSVGEVMTAATLMPRLRALNAPIFVSATTLAGYAAARKRLAAETTGCFYAPVDFAHVIRRVLNHIQPALVIVFETEIWPNLFREVKRTGGSEAICAVSAACPFQ